MLTLAAPLCLQNTPGVQQPLRSGRSQQCRAVWIYWHNYWHIHWHNYYRDQKYLVFLWEANTASVLGLALETVSGRDVKLFVLWLADYLSDFLTSVFTVNSWESNVSVLPLCCAFFSGTLILLDLIRAAAKEVECCHLLLSHSEVAA